VDLYKRSGLRGHVDLGVRITRGRCGRDLHLTRVHFQDTTATSTPGGYGGQADLTGRQDKAGGVSSVALNTDEMAGAEETGLMPHCRMVSTVT
jgi:hypothetical protein